MTSVTEWLSTADTIYFFSWFSYRLISLFFWQWTVAVEMQLFRSTFSTQRQAGENSYTAVIWAVMTVVKTDANKGGKKDKSHTGTRCYWCHLQIKPLIAEAANEALSFPFGEINGVKQAQYVSVYTLKNLKTLLLFDNIGSHFNKYIPKKSTQEEKNMYFLCWRTTIFSF